MRIIRCLRLAWQLSRNYRELEKYFLSKYRLKVSVRGHVRNDAVMFEMNLSDALAYRRFTGQSEILKLLARYQTDEYVIELLPEPRQ